MANQLIGLGNMGVQRVVRENVMYKYDRYKFLKRWCEVQAHEDLGKSCEFGVLEAHEVGPESLARAVGSPAVYERNAQDLRRHGVEVPFPLCWGEFRRGDVFMSPFHRGEFFVVRGRRVVVENVHGNSLMMGSGRCKKAVSVSVRRVLREKIDVVELKHVEFQTTKYLKVPSVAFARRLMLLEAL